MMQFNNGAPYIKAASFSEKGGRGLPRSFGVALIMASIVAMGACSPIPMDAPVGSTPISPVQTATCPASELQYLVGQSRTVLQTMRFGNEVRFEEPGQMYTQEYKATRTRIIIGEDGKISRILCG